MTKYQKGDLVLASTTAVKGWAIYAVEKDDGYFITVRAEDERAGHPVVQFPRSLVRAKLRDLKDARALTYAMNAAESEEAADRAVAAEKCNAAQRAAIHKWCDQ